MINNSLITPGTPEYEEYWYGKGKKLATKAAELLATKGSLDWPLVFPATRKTTRGYPSEVIRLASQKPGITDLEVDPTEPVVKGFVESMGVDTLFDIARSTRVSGFDPVLTGIFRGEDYPDGVLEKLKFAYLPGIMIDFVPTITPAAQ